MHHTTKLDLDKFHLRAPPRGRVFRMRKKVLIIITKSNFGGAQRYVFDLATNLSKSDFDIVVAAGGTGERKKGPGRLFTLLQKENIPTRFIQNFARDIFILDDVTSFFELCFLIRKERPDILHVTSSKAGGLGALAGRVCGVKKIVFTSHGLAYDEDRPWIKKALITMATWFTLLFAHEVIMISKETERRAQTLPFAKKKIHLVHNGLKIPSYLPRDTARQKLFELSKTSLPRSVTLIGTISELTKNKGLHYFLDALLLLHTARKDFLVIIMGEGEERPKLEAAIQARGLENHVALPGFVANAPELLPGLDVFTLTSVKEGLPYVLLEAGFAHLPVVASTIPGVTDIIEHEKTGRLVPPKDSDAITNALTALLDNQDRAHALGNQLYKKVSEEFSLARMIENTANVYTYTGPRSS